MCDTGEMTGKTAILCPCQICQVRRSWDSYERCTAMLVGACEYYHGSRGMGAEEFLIGGDLDIACEGGDWRGHVGIPWTRQLGLV